MLLRRTPTPELKFEAEQRQIYMKSNTASTTGRIASDLKNKLKLPYKQRCPQKTPRFYEAAIREIRELRIPTSPISRASDRRINSKFYNSLR